MGTATMNGVLYSLKFAIGSEPDGFLADLSKRVQGGAKHQAPTRTGQFSRISVFSSRFSEVVDGNVKAHIEYLFLVAGSLGPLPWLVAILESYGAVSFPLGQEAWEWSAVDDIVVA